MKRVVLYTLAVIILGTAFSAITGAILQFVPYFFCGMLTVSPFYGLFRKVSQGKTHGVHELFSYCSRLFQLSKGSVAVIGTVAVVVLTLRLKIAEVFLQTILYSTVTVVAMFLFWETARIIIKLTKNVEILSFVEAIKSAF